METDQFVEDDSQSTPAVGRVGVAYEN